MIIDYFRYENNDQCYLSIPVNVYKISLVTKETEIDLLGETILRVVEKNEGISMDNITGLLGIPKEYGELVKKEIRELIQKNFIATSSPAVEGLWVDIFSNLRHVKNPSTVGEKRTFYTIFDRLNKRFIPILLQREVLEKFMMDYRNNSICVRLQEEKGTTPATIEEDIRSLVEAYNRSIHRGEEERSSGEDALEKQEPLDFITNDLQELGELELWEIINRNAPLVGELLINYHLDEENTLRYLWPFAQGHGVTKGESPYYNTYIKDKIGEQNERKLRKYLVDTDTKLFSQEKKFTKPHRDYEGMATEKVIKHREVLEVFKFKKEIKELLKYCERDYMRFVEEEKGWTYIQGILLNLENVYKLMLGNAIEGIRVPRVSLFTIRIKDFMSSQMAKKFPHQELLAEIEGVKVWIEKDKSLQETVKIKSLLSYWIIIYIGYHALNCGHAKKIVGILEEGNGGERPLIVGIENLRRLRNNTLHRLDKDTRLDPNYNIKDMSFERVKEELGKALQDVYVIAEKLSSII